MSDASRWWDSPLAVEQFALDAVEAASGAARRLAAARGSARRVEAARERVPAAFAALEHLRVEGRPASPWAPLSGFVEVADGWVRLHGNYPHHAAAIERALGVRTRDQLAEAAAGRTAQAVAEAVHAAGGVAVAVHTPQQWAAHPQAHATAADPWIEVDVRGGPRRAAAPDRTGRDMAPLRGDDLPLHGVRVLDLTRVIAGPTGSQLLGCLGAEVLRLDPPHRPEILDQHLSAAMGKRSAVADLAELGTVLHGELIPRADVIVLGYRPGSLTRFGLDADALLERHPHLVVASLSAWGEHGPWGGRGGFDSIVQAATGIAALCAGPEGRPGALPVQALDHATGFRLAGAVMELLTAGSTGVIRASLLGASRNLLARPAPDRTGPLELPAPRLLDLPSPHGTLSLVPPPFDIDGQPLSAPIGGYGASRPAW